MEKNSKVVIRMNKDSKGCICISTPVQISKSYGMGIGFTQYYSKKLKLYNLGTEKIND